MKESCRGEYIYVLYVCTVCIVDVCLCEGWLQPTVPSS